MSPLKMFEYMAAGRPIVTSDLPTVRDVLSEKEAFFCIPGDAQSFQAAVRTVLEDRAEADRRTAAALSLVKEHIWEKRMARILHAD